MLSSESYSANQSPGHISFICLLRRCSVLEYSDPYMTDYPETIGPA